MRGLVRPLAELLRPVIKQLGSQIAYRATLTCQQVTRAI